VTCSSLQQEVYRRCKKDESCCVVVPGMMTAVRFSANTKSRVDIFGFVPFGCFIEVFFLCAFAEPTGETVRLSQMQS